MMDQDDSDLVSVSEFSQEEDISQKDSDTDEGGKKKKKIKAEEIGSKESKSVFRAKMMVYLVLIVSCVTAATLTYFFTSDQEEDDFENDFKTFAEEISRVAKADLSAKFDVAESMSISTTSYAIERGDQFPYVTMPDFERRTQKAREMSGAEFITVTPLCDTDIITQWESYAQLESSWIQEGLAVQGLSSVNPGPVPLNIHPLLVEGEEIPPNEGILKGMVAPCWQTGKAPINATIVNTDFLTWGTYLEVATAVVQARKGFISKIDDIPITEMGYFDYHDRRRLSGEYPHSFILQPVYKDFLGTSIIVGLYMLVVPWDIYFQDILPEGTDGVEVVLSDSCGGTYTYELLGPVGNLKGEGDLHDTEYDKHRVSSQLTDQGSATQCDYTLDIYPSDKLKNKYESKDPLIFAISVALIFVFTTMVFLVYDWAVQRRQWMIIRAARKTQAIVSSLFPKNVQDRIMKDVDEEVNREANGPLITRGNRTKDQLQNFLKGKEATTDGVEGEGAKRSKPIADLFPEATIIFADIVGFTAWSSTREPSQVFQLLETIYHVFDEIANRRRVFKVETVGDCYVAVAGLPEPRKDHAIVMARFARDCLMQFTSTVKAMVVELGPDTEELGVRIGLHSGPVTAGVLRGERARFQLFGDTVNTTARMESTGIPNKIHVSQETADLLAAAGKSQWLRTRKEKVVAKGKGELQTYWLDSTGETGTSTTSGESDEEDSKTGDVNSAQVTQVVAAAPAVPSADKYNRLVAWNCDILAKLLTQIVARRESRSTEPDAVAEIRKLEEQYGSNRYVLSEVQEIVRLPKFEADSQRVDPWSVQLGEEVLNQLKDYVQTLAAMYRDNPFHNFEHASHVTMSVMKLLSRIVAPDLASAPTDTEEALHDHTYGITSDPMTQFAVALSALIHDVDHPGVPNSQLIKEQTSLAAVYRNKSIAEQNSVDLAWDLLMDDAYSDLRRTIYVTKTEFLRFRQLVVNIVLATDIMDKDLGALRKGRWNRAFSEQSSDSSEDDVNRKATIVMEHLIQASDVAHTMQHWHIYRKWNQRLFKEMYEAFLQGRAEKDPSSNWYEGEKGFFDFYIIPLAKKLKDCGVFGVSSDEYLQYAVQNRKEWDLKGQELVAEMIQGFRDQGRVPEKLPAPAPEQAPASDLKVQDKTLV
eukprot:CAMPEP_0172441438 /NCGR_PEP_ID=MMETSP1065-20121228/1982_1 /TAXON_ID=265537 /ORGANISM="Amphiprora paludosa, Strain CCMP125" /LENGTH=1154 /DNA_ID=CAMNT_0013190803 /DNA_START=176 /DNA_END=3640 /DNA_ORIENTATION=+